MKDQAIVLIWIGVVLTAVILGYQYISADQATRTQALYERLHTLERKIETLTLQFDDTLEQVLLLQHVMEHLESDHDHDASTVKNVPQKLKKH